MYYHIHDGINTWSKFDGHTYFVICSLPSSNYKGIDTVVFTVLRPHRMGILLSGTDVISARVFNIFQEVVRLQMLPRWYGIFPQSLALRLRPH